MKRYMLTALLLFAGAGAAQAQRTTEQFIPIGQSPGISGEHSYIGAITAVDVARKTFTLQDSTGLHTIKVMERTRIWRDRSAERRSNEVGAMTDLQVGRRVEVKYIDEDTRGAADWIKVVVTGSSPL